MTFQNISVVHVYFIRGQEKLSMGKLVLKERRIFLNTLLNSLKPD